MDCLAPLFSDGGERVRSCVPGWAYKDRRPYMELSEPDLTSSASLPEQLQFYHVSLCAISHPANVKSTSR